MLEMRHLCTGDPPPPSSKVRRGVRRAGLREDEGEEKMYCRERKARRTKEEAPRTC